MAQAVIPLVVLAMAAAACGGDDDDAGGGRDVAAGPPPRRTTAAQRRTPPTAGDGVTLKVGYSAWPGWFPLAVAEEEGIFEQAGVDVELTYFADYIASLDALVAGSIDVNTQTLNDTIFGVAAGSAQRIFLTNDNSTGNDAIICDASITTVEDLQGKAIAAEPGVVDHFLLLQGLQGRGMTQDDIEFPGLADRRRRSRLRRWPVRLRRRLRPVHDPGAGPGRLQRAVQLGGLPRHDLRPLRRHRRRSPTSTPRRCRSSSTPGT